jgi:NADH-quinone oxidoreductase subunit D
MNEPRNMKTLVLGQKTVSDLDDELPTEPMVVNMGPSHPAMHGTIRMVLTLDGERVRHADIEMGYMHRCFEKEAEHATYSQVFPYADRLNYVSPMLNNVGWAMAVEKLLGMTKEIPERAQYIRVIVGELSRITDHLTCVGASAMELGAFTPFLWMIKAREWIWELLEMISTSASAAWSPTPRPTGRRRSSPSSSTWRRRCTSRISC